MSGARSGFSFGALKNQAFELAETILTFEGGQRRKAITFTPFLLLDNGEENLRNLAAQRIIIVARMMPETY